VATVAVPADSQYILREPLGQLLYRLLPVHGTTIFLGLHALCLLGSGLVLVGWLCRRLGRRSGLLAAMIVALAPVSAVLLLWIGMYDAFAILAWVVVLVTLGRRPGWQLAAGVLAGFQDFEQMAVGLLMVALLPGLAPSRGFVPAGGVPAWWDRGRHVRTGGLPACRGCRPGLTVVLPGPGGRVLRAARLRRR